MNGTRGARGTMYSEMNRANRQRSGSHSNLSEIDRRQTHIGGMRRSSSVTNLRTPHRGSSIRASRSPSTRTPLAVVGLTSNSEQRRRQATENTAKVFELIQSNRGLSSRLNWGNGGLKSMTPNQLIEIISDFMIQITGKNLFSKSRPNNQDAVILSFIEVLKYPQPQLINKACFKSPSAHQYYPEVIAILAFLSDLVREIKKYGTPENDMPTIGCDGFGNDEFFCEFSQKVRNNYKNYLKHDNDSLFDVEDETHLVNRLIAIKMKKADLTVQKLVERTVELEASNEQLKKNLMQSESDKYFITIEEQFIEKQNEWHKLQETLAEKRKYLKMITLTHNESALKVAAKQAEYDRLVEQIQMQKRTILDIRQLIAQETNIKNSIAMIQTENDAIQMEAADTQVKWARLQKLKFDMIKRLNDVSFHITQKLMQLPSFQRINLKDLTLDPTASEQSIETLCAHLNQIYRNCAQAKRNCQQHIQQNHDQLIDIKSQHISMTERHRSEMVKYEAANANLTALKQKCTNFECNGSTEIAQLQGKIEEKIAQKKQLNEEIDESKIKIGDLGAENIRIYEDGERKALEIIRNKQAACKQLDQLNDAIDQLFK